MIDNLFIQPLLLVINILFVFLYDFFDEPAVAVIFLSIIVNFLTLPLYKQAYRIQKAERLQREKMKQVVNHIKMSFSGDEQYMMLSAYYRVKHYSPVSFLKESFPLLLQVPIFIAAYSYLSNASVLTGAQFGPIRDLGAPDNLLKMGQLSFNVLPILMTALNLASGVVYTEGQEGRLKIQVFGLAAVFLVLLYRSPAGLVLYWTTSQVFSLVRNLIMVKHVLKKRKLILSISIITIFVVLICTATRIIQTRTGEVISELCLMLAFIYLVRVILELKNIKIPSLKRIEGVFPEVKYAGFIAVGFSLFALMGICIPASVLSASASEFVDTITGKFQVFLLTYPLMVYAGLFLLWMSIYYYFTDKNGRRVLFGLLLIFLGGGLINYFVFDLKPEFYYTDLTFDGELSITNRMAVLNNLFVGLMIAALLLLWIKRERLIKNIALIISFSLVFLGSYHMLQIPQALKAVSTGDNAVSVAQDETLNGIFALSKTEKNVIVLMLDRALSGQLPFIFDEFPELKEQFDGFVYYPNTVSYATHTIIGAPPLLGGYEYTPKTIAEDAGIEDPNSKRAEGMKVLPVLFANHGYETIVCDPPLNGTSNYADRTDISTYQLAGYFSKRSMELFETNVVPVQKHNYLMFSVYKTAPLYMRDYIYDSGNYIQAENTSLGYTQAFIDNYTALAQYSMLTKAVDSSNGSFLFIDNNTTHEPTVLEPPEYEVTPVKGHYDIPYGNRKVNGVTMKMENLDAWKHYCANVVAYRETAKWLTTLKELGVYDNTRIIIVSDHGNSLGQFTELQLDGFDAQAVNPLLLVKDFDTSGSMQTSMEFMTNADVPALAVQGIIEDAVNPFTGNPISNKEKNENNVWVEEGVKRAVNQLDGHKLSVDEYVWWTVHDSIFDKNNWEKIE